MYVAKGKPRSVVAAYIKAETRFWPIPIRDRRNVSPASARLALDFASKAHPIRARTQYPKSIKVLCNTWVAHPTRATRPLEPRRMTDATNSNNDYTPPAIWTWDKESGGRFAAINRPISGPTHDKELPVGKHPLQLYSLATPNGVKVTVMLEELLALGHTGAEYDAWLIRIHEGDQFSSGFVGVNPNSKIPALMDHSEKPGPLRVFESASILLHLAERFGAFLPASGPARTEVMNWLFWQMGAAPYLGGGFGHFYAYAPEKWEYPINRFAMEVKRQLDVLDRQLATRPFIAGEDYSIADMAIYPWYGRLIEGGAYNAGEFLAVHEYTHVMDWAARLAARPAVARGKRVNRNPPEGVRERHSAADLD